MKGKLLVALLGSFAASVAMADVSGVMTVDIQGPGGHSNGAYGNTNAVHAAARAIMEIEKAIPSQAQCVVSNFTGGVSVNAIAADGHFKVALKAKDEKEMADAENAFRGVKPGQLTGGVPADVRFTIK